MTPGRVASILDAHNQYRQTIANGEESPFPEAARMQTLVNIIFLLMIIFLFYFCDNNKLKMFQAMGPHSRSIS